MSRNLGRTIFQEMGHWIRRDWSFADVGSHWDSTEEYDDVNAETYSYFRRFVDGFRMSASVIAANSRVLDFCARTGYGTLYYYQRGKVGSAVCADVSREQGAICRRRLREAGFESFVWVPLQDYRFPLADGVFDAVLCFETIEHFPRPDLLLVELGRVTKKDGILVLTTPNVLWEPVHAFAAIVGLHHSEGPHRFIRYRRLRRMIEQGGFHIERAETTVLVPAGPPSLIKLGEWVERKTRRSLMPALGLRRVMVCRKL